MVYDDYPVMVKTSKIGLRQIAGQNLRMHWGIDFSIVGTQEEKLKTEIFSMLSGKVTAVNTKASSTSGGFYVYVTTKLITKYVTFRYYHFSKIFVKVGDLVNQGQSLGFMGNTGVNSTGEHLHVECFFHDKEITGCTGKSTDINKRYVDPLIFLDIYSRSNKNRILNDMIKRHVITQKQFDDAMNDKYFVCGPHSFYWFVTDNYTFVDYKWNVRYVERSLL